MARPTFSTDRNRKTRKRITRKTIDQKIAEKRSQLGDIWAQIKSENRLQNNLIQA